MVRETINATNYQVLTLTALNNVEGSQEFDFNLIKNKRLLIKDISFKWYLVNNSAGVPYLNSVTTIDGTVSGHNVINANTEKIFIPEQSGSNIHQAGNCTLSFKINNKPVYLNGKVDNIFINDNDLNILINEPVQTLNILFTNAKVALLNGANLATSSNIGWVCVLGVYVI